MKTAIDDLPKSESISRLRAAGLITSATTVTTVTFGDLSFNVAVTHRHFPNGGGWSFFACPGCARRARFLRLYQGSPMCRWCLAARGLRSRVELFSHASKRTAFTAPKRLERLTSSSPARLNPRPGRMLDRRASLEASLRRSLVVARQFALDEHDEMLARLMRDK